MNKTDHWNKVYENKDRTELGWYEQESTLSLKLIEECEIDKSESILDVGCGRTTLISSLLEKGYTNISALDISENAIKHLIKDIDEIDLNKVKFIVGSITESNTLKNNEKYKIWHDRAVFHFLKGDEVLEYKKILLENIQGDGYFIIATFAQNAVEKCSGLDVTRYTHKEIIDLFSDEFKHVKSVDYTYINPYDSKRPFIYNVFKK